MFGRLRRSKGSGTTSFSTRSSRSGESPTLRLPTDLLKRGFLVGAVSLLFGFGGGWLGAKVYNFSRPAETTITARQQIISSESQLISEIVKNVGSGVVSIEVKRQVSTTDIFGFGSNLRTQQAAGTGFIISGSGIIITNRHVVPLGTTSVAVTLADGTRFDNVQVIGRSAKTSNLDVAFLKITDLKGKKLSPLTLGDSSKVKVGDRVIAIGNALGQFQNTVTSGIISGYGRDVTAGDETGGSAETLTDLFQTDAAINSGNSGGPLVNFSGEVIAINTAVAGGADNIGFAIPINDVKNLIASILKKGKLEQPFLGIRYISLTDDLADELGLNVKHGAYIVPSEAGQDSIVSGSPAEKAGLKEGDIITKVNNIEINDKNTLSSVLSRFQVGDTVSLQIIRQNQKIKLQATLAPAPQD